MKKIIRAESYNPHQTLGIHPNDEGSNVIRLWRPGYSKLYLEVHGQTVEAKKIDREGMFEATVPRHTTFSDYRVYDSHVPSHDPYAFASSFGELDTYLYGKGVHYQLYDVMGARLTRHQGVSGVKFSLWAPHAKRVSVIGDFNRWDGRLHPMRSLGSSGVWELFIPGLGEGQKYKFEIKTQSNELKTKADPFALSSERRPNTASVVADVNRFQWTDRQWHEKKNKRKKQSPTYLYL